MVACALSYTADLKIRADNAYLIKVSRNGGAFTFVGDNLATLPGPSWKNTYTESICNVNNCDVIKIFIKNLDDGW